MRLSVTRTALALALTVPPAIAAPASAATFTVTNTNDPGPGSLRQAMISANASPGHDDIVFAPGVTGTIALTQGELSVQSDMSIDGPGVGALSVSGNHAGRVFNISSQPPGTARISNLTITEGLVHASDGGSAGDSGDNGAGGGILNQGSLTLVRTQVIGNRVEGGNGANGGRIKSGGAGGNGTGGGIYSSGTLVLSETLVAGNTAHGGFGGDAPGTVTLHAGEGGNGWGGGIFAQGTLIADGSRLAGNTAAGGEGGNSVPDFSRGRRGGEGNGGGIAFNGVSGRLNRVTVDSNTARGGPGPFGGWAYGGGIRSDLGNGELRIDNSTISGNQALGGDGAEEPRPQHVQGGGILNRAGGLTIEGSTIRNNNLKGGSKHNDSSTIAGGGIENIDGGRLNLSNSTITANSAEVGGGLDNRDQGNKAVTFVTAVTLAGNEATGAGANVANPGPAMWMSLANTIIAKPRGATPSCAGQISSDGYNLDQGTSCGLGNPTDLGKKDPQLGELADNGGPTKTMAIPRSSPALDQGRRFGLFFDQRSLRRPVSFGVQRPPGGDGSDIGAFEIQGESNANAACGGRRATIVAANTGSARGTRRSDVIDGTRRGERVLGRRAGDRICGRGGRDVLRGQRGSDRIWGNSGGDAIRSGPGADRIRDLRGRNAIVCGGGNDRVVTNRGSSVAADCERVRRVSG